MKQLFGRISTPGISHPLIEFLSHRTDINSVIKPDLQEAVQLAQIVGQVDLFLLEMDAGGAAVNTLKAKLGNVQILSFERSKDVNQLKDEVLKLLGEEEVSNELYVSMPIHLFYHFDRLNVDTFLKIIKNGENHWVRRFIADEDLDHSDLDGYQQKNVKELWIEKPHIKAFSKKLIERLHARIGTTLSGGVDSVQQAQSVFQSMTEINHKMGIKAPMVAVCEEWVQKITTDCLKVKDDSVRNWWKKLQSNPELDFHYRLVRLTSLLCTQYVLMTDWTTKEEQAQKLTSVALFADMELASTDWIHHRSHAGLQSLSPEERLAVGGHASFAAKKLRESNFISKDVALLVAQHHGHVSGENLPERVTATLSPLALVYMCCEEMAYQTLRYPEVPVRESYKKILDKYKDSILRKHLESMNQIFNW